MSFQKMLTEKVDIYWLKEKQGTGSYGVPGQTEYYYDSTPDLSNVDAYVTNSGWKSMITQAEPHISVANTFLLIVHPDVQIKLNDKILFNNVEYKTKVPRIIHGHHLEVEMTRVEKQ